MSDVLRCRSEQKLLDFPEHQNLGNSTWMLSLVHLLSDEGREREEGT